MSIRAGWLLAFVLLLSTPLAAERKPLVKHPQANVQGANFSVETDPATGNLAIRYRQGERPVTVIYEPPNKLALTIEASVALDAKGIFTYTYQIASSRESRQPVTALVVEYQGVVFDLAAPPAWQFRPMSFLSAVMWSITGDEPGLAPGKRQAGFAWSSSIHPISERFTSSIGSTDGFFHDRGTLPGIVSCHAVGHDEVVSFPDEPPPGVEDALPSFPFDGVGGRTVGPVSLPEERQAATLAARLPAYIQESYELGWIETEPVFLKYRQALDQVRRAVEAGDAQTAGPLLIVLEGQAEADFKARSLTSEAYALLKHNSAFLRSLLREGNMR